jgi:NAD(P)H-dependent nitrite reductase small subunit
VPTEFVNVAKVSEIAEKRGKLIRVGVDEISLFKVDGKVYAINNVCAHQHFSMLHQGEVNGGTVSCPMHGWTYSLETGAATTGNGCVKTYPVRVVGENVFIEIQTTE